MAKKLFVGGILRDATEDAVKEKLQENFSKFGEVTNVAVIMDQFSGKCRGFAFVEMSDDDAAGKAVEGLNGQVVEGITFNQLTVNEARPKEENNNRR